MKISRDQFDFEKGELVLINKPLTWTSFDVVKKIRNTVRQKKVGHAGTLDPLASGLLIIAIGKYTKKLNELQLLDKTYDGVMEIGKTTPSYDLETEFDSEQSTKNIEQKDLSRCSELFTGEIEQRPPPFSAIKKNGERAYVKARKGEKVELKSRKVRIDEFRILNSDFSNLEFEVKCSKGTYIRSLVHDFGQKLGCGAYLKKLRRTAIGEYQLKDAYDLEDFVKIFSEK